MRIYYVFIICLHYISASEYILSVPHTMSKINAEQILMEYKSAHKEQSRAAKEREKNLMGFLNDYMAPLQVIKQQFPDHKFEIQLEIEREVSTAIPAIRRMAHKIGPVHHPAAHHAPQPKHAPPPTPPPPTYASHPPLAASYPPPPASYPPPPASYPPPPASYPPPPASYPPPPPPPTYASHPPPPVTHPPPATHPPPSATHPKPPASHPSPRAKHPPPPAHPTPHTTHQPPHPHPPPQPQQDPQLYPPQQPVQYYQPPQPNQPLPPQPTVVINQPPYARTLYIDDLQSVVENIMQRISHTSKSTFRVRHGLAKRSQINIKPILELLEKGVKIQHNMPQPKDSNMDWIQIKVPKPK